MGKIKGEPMKTLAFTGFLFCGAALLLVLVTGATNTTYALSIIGTLLIIISYREEV